MSKVKTDQLALNGGTPVFQPGELPDVLNRSGRDIGQPELELVTEVLESGTLGGRAGTKTKAFEKAFADRFGVRHAVSSSSGTAAVHLAVLALDIEPGDEIITAPITDMGSITGILYQNAIPIFADVDPRTLNVTAESIETRLSARTKAILVVHLAGHPCEMDPVMKLAERHRLPLIEDCAQSFLAEYQGRITGTIGNIAAFSLRQNKHLNVGMGGMTITNNQGLAERARLCANKGLQRTEEGFVQYSFLAPNYLMSELSAAVGLAQLERLDSVVERRQRNAHLLSTLIEPVQGVNPPYVADWATHTYFAYVLGLDRRVLNVSVMEFAQALRAEGLFAEGRYFGHHVKYLDDVLQHQKAYGASGCPFDCPCYGKEVRYGPGLCPVAEEVNQQIVCLSWTEKYTEEHIHRIAQAIDKVARHYARMEQIPNPESQI